MVSGRGAQEIAAERCNTSGAAAAAKSPAIRRDGTTGRARLQLALERKDHRARLGSVPGRYCDSLPGTLKSKLPENGVFRSAQLFSTLLVVPAARSRQAPSGRQPSCTWSTLLCPRRGPLAAPPEARTLPTLGANPLERPPAHQHDEAYPNLSRCASEAPAAFL